MPGLKTGISKIGSVDTKAKRHTHFNIRGFTFLKDAVYILDIPTTTYILISEDLTMCIKVFKRSVVHHHRLQQPVRLGWRIVDKGAVLRNELKHPKSVGEQSLN